MFKIINRLIWSPLYWSPLLNTDRDFITDKYPNDVCYLRMNNFPDEPLWTLFYKGESISFDDTPSVWNITYRNEE
jgi:hypothetical protein